MARFSFSKDDEYSINIDLKNFLENHFRTLDNEALHLDEVISIIDKKFPQTISEDEIALRIKREKKTVQRVFINAFGMNYKKLIEAFSIYCSLILLCKTRFDITDISIKLNYSDLSNMDRDFQKVLGITPCRAREELKQITPDRLFRRYYCRKKFYKNFSKCPFWISGFSV